MSQDRFFVYERVNPPFLSPRSLIRNGISFFGKDTTAEEYLDICSQIILEGNDEAIKHGASLQSLEDWLCKFKYTPEVYIIEWEREKEIYDERYK